VQAEDLDDLTSEDAAKGTKDHHPGDSNSQVMSALDSIAEQNQSTQAQSWLVCGSMTRTSTMLLMPKISTIARIISSKMVECSVKH